MGNEGKKKEYDEVWAVEAALAEAFFRENPGDVNVTELPAKKIGAVALPQTRIQIRGEDATALYRKFYFRFMRGGG